MLLWAAVSCESLPRPTRHSLGTLRGVRRGTPDSGCPWHPRAQPAYTHLTLGSMSELFAARHGRSAWETVLPLGQFTLQNLSLLDSLESLKVFSVELGASVSDSCPPLGAAVPLETLL